MHTNFAVYPMPIPRDPFAILRADHRRIERCFESYREAENDAHPMLLIQGIARAVTMHLDIEEAIVYPFYLQTTGNTLRHRRWVAEHAKERKLLADVTYADPGDESLEYALAELALRIVPHIREEESESGMLSEIIRAGVDLDALGRRLGHYRDNYIATSMGS